MQNQVIVYVEIKTGFSILNQSLQIQSIVLFDEIILFSMSCTIIHSLLCRPLILGALVMTLVLHNSHTFIYIGVCCIVTYIDEQRMLVLLTTTHEKVLFLIA